MHHKIMVDQRELEYLLTMPEKVIERYTSDRYVKDWEAKKVAIPPLPFVEYGDRTKRFVVAKVLAWAEQHFTVGGTRA